MTPECRPAAGAEDGSLHWLSLGDDADVCRWHTGANGKEFWITSSGEIGEPETAWYGGYRYMFPASPNDAAELVEARKEIDRLNDQLRTKSASTTAYIKAARARFKRDAKRIAELEAETERLRTVLEEIKRVGTKTYSRQVGDMYDLENGYDDITSVSEEAEIADSALHPAPEADDTTAGEKDA